MWLQKLRFERNWQKLKTVNWKLLSCVWLCERMDYIVHGILQARILEWEAFPFSREIFPTQGWNPGPRTAGGFSTSWVTREAQTKLEYKHSTWFASKLEKWQLNWDKFQLKGGHK